MTRRPISFVWSFRATCARSRAARFSLGHLPRYTYLTLTPELIDVSLSSYSKRLSPIDPTPINVAIAGRRKVDGGFEEMAKVMMRPCGLWFCYRDTLFGAGLRTPCDIQELEFHKPLDGGVWKTQEVVTRYNIPEPEVAEPATVYNTVIYSPLRASVEVLSVPPLFLQESGHSGGIPVEWNLAEGPAKLFIPFVYFRWITNNICLAIMLTKHDHPLPPTTTMLVTAAKQMTNDVVRSSSSLSNDNPSTRRRTRAPTRLHRP
ncbi:uncharacterized protein LACBIDRAFT_335828 [Laccaria bicolor S238N-H82]|uniref:Predicted protein n=1 Tax=Laccaria bicolor (strain S238N-H82 / ATCC MYA-4686) TaxID=486041 RepID=B0E3J8_LACBS|nr:uncharacterized protein LACBIDRAFT_335828 [Laccaria bicolor S238N-H82]EDQ98590.1 predicted protein [Laccaria bicolor S238N-H82]|eukprot:XP_001890766.1 predicted protein [Laccaria bicolor S238N-H82]